MDMFNGLFRNGFGVTARFWNLFYLFSILKIQMKMLTERSQVDVNVKVE